MTRQQNLQSTDRTKHESIRGRHASEKHLDFEPYSRFGRNFQHTPMTPNEVKSDQICVRSDLEEIFWISYFAMRDRSQSRKNKSYHRHEASKHEEKGTITKWQNRRTQPIYL